MIRVSMALAANKKVCHPERGEGPAVRLQRSPGVHHSVL